MRCDAMRCGNHSCLLTHTHTPTHTLSLITVWLDWGPASAAYANSGVAVGQERVGEHSRSLTSASGLRTMSSTGLSTFTLNQVEPRRRHTHS